MDYSNDNIEKQLREKGYKMTGQRKAVLDCIKKHEKEHLSPEEIFSIVRTVNPDIGLATVYRTLALLNKMKIVHKLNFDDGYARYEINRHDEEHRHHHLICLKCGTVSEVEEDLLEGLEEKINKKHNFIVKDHRVKFYGICRECVMKE